VAWFWLGALPTARQHLEAGIARHTPDQRRAPVFRIGQDVGVACQANAARTLWLLGYPAQALAHLHEALAVAHELSHPYSLAFAWCVAAFVFQFCRDVLVVHEQAEACVALATAQGFPQWAAMGRSLRGWALALQGRGKVPLPGDVSRAHHGVLFLDELPECRHHVLEVLSQPLGMLQHQWAFTPAKA
jgi:Magnesium chelatase, subunit ChlI